jgi:hypothetical protein
MGKQAAEVTHAFNQGKPSSRSRFRVLTSWFVFMFGSVFRSSEFEGMPEVHLPHLDDEDDDPPQAPPAPASQHPRSKRLLKLALEVLLISAGVFLGLAGEQWRESREHRERAQASLRRFQAELGHNKKSVAEVRDYHTKLRTSLREYMAATPEQRKSISIKMQGIRPVFFENTAWDVALATQSLADIPEDLAYEISRVYRIQQAHGQLSQGVLNSMYINSPYAAGDAFLMAVAVYLDDATLLEPELLKAYDAVLPKIEAEREK